MARSTSRARSPSSSRWRSWTIRCSRSRRIRIRRLELLGGGNGEGAFPPPFPFPYRRKAKEKGKFYGLGEPIDYTVESFVQAPDRVCNEIHGEVLGKKFEWVQIINGDRGWFSRDGNTQEFSEEERAEAMEALYANLVAQLFPLAGKEFKFSSLDESKIGDMDTLGIKVSNQDHRHVSLYFDKRTWLLVKRESMVKDFANEGSEVAEEISYGDYKENKGVKYPGKVTIRRDGKTYFECEITEYQALDKLDAKLFEKPKD